MKSKFSLYIYSVILISIIVIFQLFYNFQIKNKKKNYQINSQIILKCKQNDHLIINLDCSNFLSVAGEEVYSNLAFVNNYKILRDISGDSKNFKFSSFEESENKNIENKIVNSIEIESKKYFNFRVEKEINRYNQEKNRLLLDYFYPDNTSKDQKKTVLNLTDEIDKNIDIVSSINISEMYDIIVIGNKKIIKNRFSRLNNLNVFIISIIFGIFSILITASIFDLIRNNKRN